MSPIDDLYPVPCAFCKISQAYPADATAPVPSRPDPDKISPQCHLILSTPHVLAFLDILPMAPGHILVTTRDHYQKLSDLHTPSSSSSPATSDWVSRRRHEKQKQTARELGHWLPIVSRAMCKVTEVEDWNVVQNNGERAAQVVPHIHFHLIPRYQDGRRQTQNASSGLSKSWTMFGRGAREDLDDDEGAEMAKALREALRVEIEEEEQVAKSKL